MTDAGAAAASATDDPARRALVALVLAGLRAPLDPVAQARLDALIATVPDGQVIADDMVERWLMAGIVGRVALSDDAADGAREPVADRAPAPPPPRAMSRRRVLRFAGGATAAGIAGLAGYHGWQAIRPAPAGDERIIAARGNAPSHARLLDGSSVMLSRDARIASTMSADQRHIRHLSGEVFYTVAKDTARPFVVEAGGYRLTALGTGFNVDPLADGVCVDLLEGRLRIDRIDGGHPLILSAGQRFVGGEMEVRVMPADPDAAAWGDGRLMFDDVALADVARRLANHSDVALVLNDRAVAALRFSGVMDVATPRAWRLGLEAALPVRVVEQPDGLHVAMAPRRGGTRILLQ